MTDTDTVSDLFKDIPGLFPVNNQKTIAAAAIEAFAIAKLDVIECIEQRKGEGLDTYSKSFLLKKYCKNIFAIVDYLRTEIFPDRWEFQATMYDNHIILLKRSDLILMVNKSHAEYRLYVYGSYDDCVNLKKRCGKDDNRLKLNWWFLSEDESYFEQRDIDFHSDMTIKDEYYPYIQTKEGSGVSSYLKKYMESKSPVLLFMGEPGTGKTSLLRHLISEYRLNTVVTYDEKIMAADSFYVQFMTDTKKQLLVIEDADLLLASREKSDNKTMSKILNVSDGLIQLGQKKIIFTTNLESMAQVDNALLRPGRCFDVMEFRKLTYSETLKACEAAGLEPLTKEKDYPLSEIFNRHQQSYYSNKSMGF